MQWVSAVFICKKRKKYWTLKIRNRKDGDCSAAPVFLLTRCCYET